MADTRLSIRLDLTSGDRIGPGKIALLEAIQATGSISAAARRLGMSYRRAWLLVDQINQALQFHRADRTVLGQRGISGRGQVAPEGRHATRLMHDVPGDPRAIFSRHRRQAG
jgi:molybdate transport system regulatory protein